MMLARICKSYTFDAAHFLPDHPGKCRKLHGHTYTLEVEVRGVIGELDGMVVDFSVIDDAVKNIIAKWDHSYLNEELSITPTAENLASEAFKWIRFMENSEDGVVVSRVRIWETPSSWAEVQEEDQSGSS